MILFSETGSQVLHIISGSLLIIFAIIAFFSFKIRKVNSELKEKNRQVLLINSDLQKTNKELAVQKEVIVREHYESEKFYGMLLQSADDGIAFYDQSGNLKYANSAFYSMLGLDSLNYSAFNIEKIIHPDDLDYITRRQKSLDAKGFFDSPLRLLHKGADYLCFSTRSVMVRSDSGDVLGSLTISRDITRQQQGHEDLLKAKAEAEASNRLKSSFLANISHEIRTPLNSVVGFSNLLLADDLSRKTREEYVEHINYNSEKLIQIIGDIIDLSRLESSQIEIRYEESSLNAIVNEVIEETRRIIRRNEKPIILDLKNEFSESGDLIFTDRVWLKRVLSHLMDNAVKFTLDGEVELLCTLSDDNIVFRVKDTGIGINKENLSRIFEEFRQEIDAHHRPFEGLGVGLTLAKEVVERMGGKIFVRSEKGMGSEFSFSLPYRPAGTNRVKLLQDEDRTVVTNWKQKKCLLVDDNKDVIIYLEKILTDTGMTTIIARSGYEAVDIIKNNPDIGLVLLDMQMPGMNGIEATKEIRKIRKDLTIIAQTAFIFEDDKDIILEAGCDACLIKPIRRENLLSTLSVFLK